MTSSSNHEQADDLGEVAKFFSDARNESENSGVVTLWEALDGTQRKQILLAEYRCKHVQRGCLLLSVFRLPGGRFFYKPRHTLSPSRAESDTVPAAQAKWTSDGYRHWNAQAGSLDRLISFSSDRNKGGIRLDCGHIRDSLVTVAQLDADSSGLPGPKPPILRG